MRKIQAAPPTRPLARWLSLAASASALPLLFLSACSSVEEQPTQPVQPTMAPPPLEDWEPPQINSGRPRVVEYDGDDGDSRRDPGGRGGWGSLDEDLGAAGMAPSPLQGWIRN